MLADDMTDQEAVDLIMAAVRNGVAFLDERTPGWLPKVVEVIAKEEFKLSSCYTCALAVAAGNEYSLACYKLGLAGNGSDYEASLGFWAPFNSDILEACKKLYGHLSSIEQDLTGNDRWTPLTLGWEWAIMERLAQQPAEA